MKKEYIIAGIGSLVLFGVLYYFNRRSSSIPSQQQQSSQQGQGNQGQGQQGQSQQGGQGQQGGVESGEDDIFPTTPGVFNTPDAIETISPTLNVALARKNCARRGGTWMPNSSGGGTCINIPAPTSGSSATGVISAPVITPRTSTTSSSSSSSSSGGYGGSGGGSSSGGSMALSNLGALYGGYGTTSSNYQSNLSSYGSANINIINQLNQY